MTNFIGTVGSARRARGFSLIELVIVVVIIGIIGAIAIPRMSRGAKGAAESSLIADLATVRNSIDLYAAEHGGAFPALATFTAQMTTYSDTAGGTSATKTATKIYGPYLRGVPKLKVGSVLQVNTVVGTLDGLGGWVYTVGDGSIYANLAASELDDAGVAYKDY